MLSYLRLRSAGSAIGIGLVLLTSCQTAEIEPAEFDYYSSGADFTPEVASGSVPPAQDTQWANSSGAGSSAAAIVVTVQKGDSLYGLSRRHLGDGSRWQEIVALNGLTEADIRGLAIGRELRIPIR